VIIPIGDTPEGIVIDQVHQDVLIALRRPDALAVVTLGASHAVRRIATPGRARHLRLAAPGGPLLLAGEDTNALYELTLPGGKVTARFSTPRQPHDAVAVDGHIWVTDELAGKVSVLDPATGKETKTLPAGVQPGGLGAAGDRVAAADVRGNQLYVYDAKTLRQVATLPAGAGPTHVVQVGPTTVAVADTRGDAVLLYDLKGKPRQIARLPLAGGPYGLAADLDRHVLWVALSGRNQLVKVNVLADALRDSGVRIDTVQQPNSVAVDSDTGLLAVAGATSRGLLQLLPAR
jgi:YVTN family beta-propeller protein